MNGLERPVKKQRVSPLIPRYYQPLAKRVPGIADLDTPVLAAYEVVVRRLLASATDEEADTGKRQSWEPGWRKAESTITTKAREVKWERR